jgi:hypothetical protein
MADHYTKPLPRILFYRHNDYNMGQVPPTYSPKYLECLRIYSVPQQKNTTTKHKEYAARAAKHWHLGNTSFYVFMVLHFYSPLQLFTYNFEILYVWSLKRGGVTDIT